MPLPTVIVLASGRGERFRASGGTSHKLQAVVAGRTVLDHTLQRVRDCGLPFYIEDRGHPGMGDSIAAAVKATSEAHGWLILPADLPCVQPETLQRVASALTEHPVVVPMFEGQRGHPVGFSRICGKALQALRGEQGGAQLTRQHTPFFMEVADSGITMDIDTVDDLQRFARRLGSTQ